MSTRCVINFCYERGKDVAKIYRHWDGYPDSVLPDLDQFFCDVEAQTDDTRFSDPSYLAAKYVVWQAGKNARDPKKPLDFLSVGVLNEVPGDAEFEYWVIASTDRTFPAIEHAPSRGY